MRSEDAIRASAEELREQLERHRQLLRSALADEGGERKMDLCPRVECPHERRLRELLLETIRVLEQTRKSFKSKRLKRLREKLTGVLAEQVGRRPTDR